MSNAVFPVTLPGLTYPWLKTPNFHTIVQSAPNDAEVRLAQTVNPIWKFQLEYEYLYDSKVTPNFAYSPFKTLLGFFLSRSGQYDDFLLSDPDDNAVPPPVSAVWAANWGYGLGECILDPSGHYQGVTTAGISGGSQPSWNDSGGTTTDGGITWKDLGTSKGLLINDQINQKVTDGTFEYSPIRRNLGGFFEDITDINGSMSVFANGTLQTGGGVNYTLLGPGLSVAGSSFGGRYLKWVGNPTPPITAIYNFYYRVRYDGDDQDFEKFMNQLWNMGGQHTKSGKGTLNLITSRPPAV